MDDRDCLAFYPFVVVRIACRVCSRTGSYRLARLAAKFGHKPKEDDDHAWTDLVPFSTSLSPSEYPVSLP
jgi:hypothetical protein